MIRHKHVLQISRFIWFVFPIQLACLGTYPPQRIEQCKFCQENSDTLEIVTIVSLGLRHSVVVAAAIVDTHEDAPLQQLVHLRQCDGSDVVQLLCRRLFLRRAVPPAGAKNTAQTPLRGAVQVALSLDISTFKT